MSFEKPEWEELGGLGGLKLPKGEFTVYGTAYMHPEHADKAYEVYKTLVTLAKSEPGTLSYHVSRDQDDPSVFHFFERFKDKAAFEEHNASQIVKDMFGECNKSVRAVFAKPIEGK